MGSSWFVDKVIIETFLKVSTDVSELRRDVVTSLDLKLGFPSAETIVFLTLLPAESS